MPAHWEAFVALTSIDDSVGKQSSMKGMSVLRELIASERLLRFALFSEGIPANKVEQITMSKVYERFTFPLALGLTWFHFPSFLPSIRFDSSHSARQRFVNQSKRV